MDTVVTSVLTAKHIEAFKKIVGEKFVLVDEESLHYSRHGFIFASPISFCKFMS